MKERKETQEIVTEHEEETCIDIGTLQAQIAEQEDQIKSKELQIAQLEARLKWYEEQYRLSQKKRFGKSSESEGQLSIFNEVEAESQAKAPEPTIEEIVVRRKKRVGKRAEDLSKLPVEQMIYELPAQERVCPECGGEMHAMGKETLRYDVDVIPAKVVLRQHVSVAYACRCCEHKGTSVPIRKAPVPAPVIPKSVASAELVSDIIVQKYVMATPLYRLEQSYERMDVPINRTNMANWLIYVAQHWLKPLYALLSSQLIQRDVLHADETVMQVIREPNRSANTNSYMWLYRSGGYEQGPPIVIYEYQPTRSAAHPKRFLQGFTGYLHTDGYQAYHNMSPDITVVGCFAHLRRKYHEALHSLPKEEWKGSAAEIGLAYCNQLFTLEAKWTKLTPQDRYELRKEQSLPIAKELFAWAKGVQAMPKSKLGQAIEYTISQWPYLMNVYLDGRLELSNNRAERSIKPFVIGRKNWIFSTSTKGAETSSILYSLIETAKENGLDPYLYMVTLLNRLPNGSTEANARHALYAELLPFSPMIQQTCRAHFDLRTGDDVGEGETSFPPTP